MAEKWPREGRRGREGKRAKRRPKDTEEINAEEEGERNKVTEREKEHKEERESKGDSQVGEGKMVDEGGEEQRVSELCEPITVIMVLPSSGPTATTAWRRISGLYIGCLPCSLSRRLMD